MNGSQANQRRFPYPECRFPLLRNHGFITQEYSEDSELLSKYIDMDSWAKKYIIEEIISELGGKEYIEPLSLLSHEGEVRV